MEMSGARSLIGLHRGSENTGCNPNTAEGGSLGRTRRAGDWDLRDGPTRRLAFQGAKRLFCLSFIDDPSELDRAIIDDARAAGVQHIVRYRQLERRPATQSGGVILSARHGFAHRECIGRF
jgi:hypothetical protein